MLVDNWKDLLAVDGRYFADRFGDTPFEHPHRHNTRYQPHAKPCTFPYKFGMQVHRKICKFYATNYLIIITRYRYFCIENLVVAFSNGTYCAPHLPEPPFPPPWALPARRASLSSLLAASSLYRWRIRIIRAMPCPFTSIYAGARLRCRHRQGLPPGHAPMAVSLYPPQFQDSESSQARARSRKGS